jgi:hypothetical protein
MLTTAEVLTYLSILWGNAEAGVALGGVIMPDEVKNYSITKKTDILLDWAKEYRTNRTFEEFFMEKLNDLVCKVNTFYYEFKKDSRRKGMCLFIAQRAPFDERQRITVYPENISDLTKNGFKMITRTQYECPDDLSLWDIQNILSSLPNFYYRKLVA